MTWPHYPGEVVRSTAVTAAAGWALLNPRAERLDASDQWEPMPHQVPPPGSWHGWLLLAGRGAGKTDALSAWITEHVHGPPCMLGAMPHRIGIVAPTQGDAVDACVSGPSGLRAHDPTATFHPATAGGTIVRWPNGSEARLFGAHSPEDVERLRAGGNRCRWWLEELAAMRHMQDVYDQALFGLRIGPDPRWAASTTPKPRLLIKELAKGGLVNGIQIAVTRATTNDNPHLPAHIRAALFAAYGDKTLGQQELYGRVIDQDDGALWRREHIEANRVSLAELPPMTRLSVGVDPSGGAGEQGIVVVGRLAVHTLENGQQKTLQHGYTLDDRTCRLSPDGWGRRAITAALDWEADDVVVEINFGGDMAVAVLRGAADALGVNVPVRTVRASRGKRVRAEPVAALSARKQWKWAGVFPELEEQCCTWTDEAGYSPDRMDALVWPAWHMKIVSTMLTGGAVFPGSALAGSQLVNPRR